jgi:hypothetical protein
LGRLGLFKNLVHVWVVLVAQLAQGLGLATRGLVVLTVFGNLLGAVVSVKVGWLPHLPPWNLLLSPLLTLEPKIVAIGIGMLEFVVAGLHKLEAVAFVENGLAEDHPFWLSLSPLQCVLLPASN